MEREKVATLQHSGSIREYIKEYLAFMLKIKIMMEEYKVYKFVIGLTEWDQREVCCDWPTKWNSARGNIIQQGEGSNSQKIYYVNPSKYFEEHSNRF